MGSFSQGGIRAESVKVPWQFSSQEDDRMQGDFTRSDKKRIRQLADLAWDRELRIELQKIAAAIEEMESGQLTPFDVTDRIHKFHNGAARDLYNQFSNSLP